MTTKKVFFVAVVLFLGMFFVSNSAAQSRDPIMGELEFSSYPDGTTGEYRVFFIVHSVPLGTGSLFCEVLTPGADPTVLENWTEQEVEILNLGVLREVFLDFTANADLLSRDDPWDDPNFPELSGDFTQSYEKAGRIVLLNWSVRDPIDIRIGVKAEDGIVTYVEPTLEMVYGFPVGNPEYFRVKTANETCPVTTMDDAITCIKNLSRGVYRVYFNADYHAGVDGTFRVIGESGLEYAVIGSKVNCPYFEVESNPAIFKFMIFLDTPQGKSLKYASGVFYDASSGLLAIDFSWYVE